MGDVYTVRLSPAQRRIRSRKGRDRPGCRFPPGHRFAFRLQGRTVRGLQMRAERGRGRAETLFHAWRSSKWNGIKNSTYCCAERWPTRISRSICSISTRKYCRNRYPVRNLEGQVTRVVKMTHDIRRLEIVLDQPLKFWAGQYVDITLPGPRDDYALVFHGKYAGRRQRTRVHHSRNTPTENSLPASTETSSPEPGSTVRGPPVTCFREEDKGGALILVGSSFGMLIAALIDLP